MTSQPAFVPQWQIEADFPSAALAPVATAESWRKEVHRPVYHVHKWWATRLGSVFRQILLSTCTPLATDGARQSPVVLDPFMGSGTTVGEALKLGMRAIGCDINPVSYFMVKTGLALPSRAELLSAFEQVRGSVAEKIRSYYRTSDPSFGLCDVLYTFWVMVVQCPVCQYPVPLFDSWVFARHAYAGRHPAAQAVCPKCGDVNAIDLRSEVVQCRSCAFHFDAHGGVFQRGRALCPSCMSGFTPISAVRRTGERPSYKMFAQMALTATGTKFYKRTTSEDRRLYDLAAKRLRELSLPLPDDEIEDGYNTRQILNYHMAKWQHLFNDRQLLCLGLLAKAIQEEVEDKRCRDALTLLFSGTLEFNNMLCSFKGEGTGAVRHIFSHHILKPQRMALENSVWGTDKSSGTFSTLFKTRLLRARDYADNPFEVGLGESGRTRRVYPGTGPLVAIEGTPEDVDAGRANLAVLCRDSSSLPVREGSVDFVVTDPPYFDMVNYSELADFFYSWLRRLVAELAPNGRTTRFEGEVQGGDARRFAHRLAAVFRECGRVLARAGLLVFTFHHSRPAGWAAAAEALRTAGFTVTAVHISKAEMSVAAPKSQARSPINVDAIIVARASEGVAKDSSLVEDETQALVERCGLPDLTDGDLRVCIGAAWLKVASSRAEWRGLDAEAANLGVLQEEVLPRLRATVPALQQPGDCLSLFEAIDVEQPLDP
jgi:putative DNA methylase